MNGGPRCIVLLCLLAVLAPAAAIEYEEYADTLMTERAFRALAAVHELMDAGRLDEASARLEAMPGRMTLIPYEQALVLQTHGYIEMQRDDPARAIEYFEACIALGALPPWARQGMVYALAGLYAGERRWTDVVDALESWLAGGAQPDAEAAVLIATAYSEVGRHRDAVPWVDGALEVSEAAPRSWYELAVAVYFEAGEHARAAASARAMVARWPDERPSWELLQGAYHELGEDQAVLASMQLAYRRGVKAREADIVDLARMQLFMDVPFRAGEMLAAEMAAGRIERNSDNLRLLLAAWEAAREFERAITVIDELTTRAPDGALALRKARLLAERRDWRGVIAAVDAALAGGLSRPQAGDALILKGMALLESGDHAAAAAIFREGVGLGGRTGEQARAWLDYIAAL